MKKVIIQWREEFVEPKQQIKLNEYRLEQWQTYHQGINGLKEAWKMWRIGFIQREDLRVTMWRRWRVAFEDQQQAKALEHKATLFLLSHSLFPNSSSSAKLNSSRVPFSSSVPTTSTIQKGLRATRTLGTNTLLVPEK